MERLFTQLELGVNENPEVPKESVLHPRDSYCPLNFACIQARGTCFMSDLQFTQEGVRESEPPMTLQKCILSVEDDEKDSLRLGLKTAGLSQKVVRLTNGEEA